MSSQTFIAVLGCFTAVLAASFGHYIYGELAAVFTMIGVMQQ